MNGGDQAAFHPISGELTRRPEQCLLCAAIRGYRTVPLEADRARLARCGDSVPLAARQSTSDCSERKESARDCACAVVAIDRLEHRPIEHCQRPASSKHAFQVKAVTLDIVYRGHRCKQMIVCSSQDVDAFGSVSLMPRLTSPDRTR